MVLLYYAWRGLFRPLKAITTSQRTRFGWTCRKRGPVPRVGLARVLPPLWGAKAGRRSRYQAMFAFES